MPEAPEKNDSHYPEYLKRLHAESLTTDEEIASLVREASGSAPVGKKRLLAGEVNEVYDIELQEKGHVVLRIHKAETPVFGQERWAIDQCRRRGVPAPTILLIKYVPGTDGVVSYCIQEKSPGDVLSRGKVPYEHLDKYQLEAILHNAGRILEKMHSIPVTGFGDLDEHGRGDKATFLEAMIRAEEKEEKYVALAKKLGIPDEQMQKVFRIIRERVPRYADTKATFNHGDFDPKHIMHIGDEVTGILDFGDVLSHAPLYDFARWEYWYGDNKMLTWLKEGYSDKSIFADSGELSRLIQLYMNIDLIKWYDERGYREGIGSESVKMKRLLQGL